MNSKPLPLGEAIALMLPHLKPLASEEKPLLDCLGLRSAEDCFAQWPQPPFDNAMMDGFAVRSADTQQPGADLLVVARQPAGRARNLKCGPGEAVRIFTGAPMPEGADAVVMQEDCELTGARVRCLVSATAGEFVRRQGSEVCIGQRLVHRGQRLTAARIGLLASQGCSHHRVIPQAKVLVVSTGDELRAPGAGPLLPGEIYESAATMLRAQIAGWGLPMPEGGHCGDHPRALAEWLGQSCNHCDVVVICGGVSVGEHDPVKPALQQLGIEPILWRIQLKPGKPFLFAKQQRPQGGSTLIFGLPGNPVSAFVTAELLLRPTLMSMQGNTDWNPERQTVVLAEELSNPGDRPHYLRGKVEGGMFYAVGLQQSHALFGLSQCNALLALAPGQSLAQGHPVEVLPC